MSLLQAGMLARRASSSFSCNKQARYSQSQEHSWAPQGKQGCAGSWAAALPWTSPLGAQLQGAQTRRQHGTIWHGTGGTQLYGTMGTAPGGSCCPGPLCYPCYPGTGSTCDQGACGALSPSQHTHLYCTDTWGPTLPRHCKHRTKGEQRPEHNTQPQQAAHSNLNTQPAMRPSRGPGTWDITAQGQTRWSSEPTCSPAATRAAGQPSRAMHRSRCCLHPAARPALCSAAPRFHHGSAAKAPCSAQISNISASFSFQKEKLRSM